MEISKQASHARTYVMEKTCDYDSTASSLRAEETNGAIDNSKFFIVFLLCKTSLVYSKK